MPRIKKADTMAPPPPRDPRTVKKGCISCVHYKLEMKAFPCRDCQEWNYWLDSKPNGNSAATVTR